MFKKKKTEKKEEKIENKIEIIKKTKNYIVLNKPAGLMVHKAPNREDKTLVDFLIKKYPKIKGVGEDEIRPGIVHRLDKEVSGLMVVALNQESFLNLKQQFKNRTIEKYYTALVYGNLEKDEDVIDFPIKRSSKGFKMAAVPNSFFSEKDTTREAITKFEVLKRFTNFSLVKIKLETGRTHQIRVHFFAINHPLVGDKLYLNKKMSTKNKKIILDRIFLVSNKLSFTDLKGEKQTFEINIPKNLQEIIDNLN